MSALPSLVALRQTLRATTSRSVVTRANPATYVSCTRLLHSSTSAANQAPASTSATSSAASGSDVPASEPLGDLNDLHSQFEVDGQMYEMPSIDEGDMMDGENLIAVPIKSSLVHVPLSRLRKPQTPSPTPRQKLYVPLSSHVFDAPARRDVIHSAVVWYLDSLRQGSANTKTRSEVRGSGRKLRPQKGSGRARLGTMSSPSLRGGAVAHGPKPRDHSTELPRRVRELALRSMLSSKWRQGELLVLPALTWVPPPGSTNLLWRLLKVKGWDDALFLTAPRNPQPSQRSLVKEARPSAADPVYEKAQRDDHQESIKNFILASRNIPRIEVIELDKLTEKYVEKVAKTSAEKKKPGELHAYQILRRKKLICDVGAIEWLEEKLGGAIFHPEATDKDLAAVEQRTDAEPAAAEQAADAVTAAMAAEAVAPSSAQAETVAPSSTVPEAAAPFITEAEAATPSSTEAESDAETPTLTAEEEKLKAEQLTKQQAQAESSMQ